eukprot:PhF_6_TR20624/c0_g1_i2/m.29719
MSDQSSITPSNTMIPVDTDVEAIEKKVVKIQSLYRGGAARERVQEIRERDQIGVISLPDPSDDTMNNENLDNSNEGKKKGLSGAIQSFPKEVQIVPMTTETLGMAAVYTRMLNTDLWW